MNDLLLNQAINNKTYLCQLNQFCTLNRLNEYINMLNTYLLDIFFAPLVPLVDYLDAGFDVGGSVRERKNKRLSFKMLRHILLLVLAPADLFVDRLVFVAIDGAVDRVGCPLLLVDHVGWVEVQRHQLGHVSLEDCLCWYAQFLLNLNTFHYLLLGQIRCQIHNSLSPQNII